MEATALGKKLFLSLLVRVLIAWYLPPDGKGTNRQCPGCVVSLLMLLAFLCRQPAYTASRSGSTAPTILCAVFITRAKLFLVSAVQLAYCTVTH